MINLQTMALDIGLHPATTSSHGMTNIIIRFVLLIPYLCMIQDMYNILQRYTNGKVTKPEKISLLLA